MSREIHIDQNRALPTKKHESYSNSRHRNGKISDITVRKSTEAPLLVEKARQSRQDVSHRAKRPTASRSSGKSHLHVNGHTVHSSVLNAAAASSQAADSPTERADSSMFVSTSPKVSMRLQRIFYAFGALVFLAAILLTIQSLILNKQTKDQIAVLGSQSTSTDSEGVAQGSGSEPAEEKPSSRAMFEYSVAPDEPRYLRIQSNSTFARVKQLGNLPDGAIDAPWNSHDVGWYNGSIKPGSKAGVSLFLGHAFGYTAPGVFKDINNMEPGDSVEVEKGDGTIVSYVVDKVVEYPLESIDMREILYASEKGTRNLRLMTCSGIFDPISHSYQSRTVVYAKEK